jgi:hypothetical protein
MPSSATEKCGGTRASTGKRFSNDSQNAWIVWMRSAPGASITRANSVRASRICTSSGWRPSRSRSSPASRASSQVDHLASSVPRRARISAAAALVKVRHKIAAGRAPASSRRTMREVKT